MNVFTHKTQLVQALRQKSEEKVSNNIKSCLAILPLLFLFSADAPRGAWIQSENRRLKILNALEANLHARWHFYWSEGKYIESERKLPPVRGSVSLSHYQRIKVEEWGVWVLLLFYRGEWVVRAARCSQYHPPLDWDVEKSGDARAHIREDNDAITTDKEHDVSRQTNVVTKTMPHLIDLHLIWLESRSDALVTNCIGRYPWRKGAAGLNFVSARQ